MHSLRECTPIGDYIYSNINCGGISDENESRVKIEIEIYNTFLSLMTFIPRPTVAVVVKKSKHYYSFFRNKQHWHYWYFRIA